MLSDVLPYLLLPVVGFAAGFVDAIAGGGGLLTVPVLASFTPDMRLVLGTNKGQAVFGSFTSLLSFVRAGKVHRARAVPTFFAALAGAVGGVELVMRIPSSALRPIVLVLLVSVAVFFLVRKKRPPQSQVVGEPPAPEPQGGLAIVRAHPVVFAVLVGVALGFYDGFFGPGTGTFLIALHTALFGDDLTEASANAKVANFASNLAAVTVFALAGQIRFAWALPMAAMQILGGYAGTRAAIKGGEKVVRTGVLAVTVALVVRLAWQMVSAS